MVIELDGSQHHTFEGKEHDKKRAEFFNEYGVIVLRINNIEVTRNFKDVCKYIDALVKTRIK